MRIADWILLLSALASPALHAEQQDTDTLLQTLLSDAQQAQARSDFFTAARDYHDALKLRPNVPELWTNFGLMQHQAGDYVEALDSFHRAIALKDSLFVPNLFVGIDSLKLKRNKEAIPYLLKAEALNPTDSQAPLALGQAYAALKNSRDAMDAYAKATTLDATSSDAWFGLGMMALKGVEDDARVITGRYVGSVYLKSLSAAAYRDVNRLTEAADMYAALLNVPGAPPCTRVEYGFVLLQRNELAEAKATFQTELEKPKRCPLTPLGIVDASLSEGNDDVAWRLLVDLWKTQRGIVQSNVHLLWDGLSSERLDEIRNFLSRDEASVGLPADLFEVLRNSLLGGDLTRGPLSRSINKNDSKSDSCGRGGPSESSVPRSVQVLHSVACDFYNGDYRLASVEARKLGGNEATRSAGLYWEIKADQNLAVVALEEAGRNAPNSPKMHVLIGDIFRRRERYLEAEEEYKKALALFPGQAGALMGLSVTYLMESRWDEALSNAQAILQKNPDDPRANLLVGEVLVFRREFSVAEPYLKISLAAEPELLPRVHELLGKCYAADDQVPQAIQEFKFAVPGDQNGSIYFQLAQLYKKNGNPVAAAAAFKVSQELHREKAQRDAVAFQDIHQSPPSEDH